MASSLSDRLRDRISRGLRSQTDIEAEELQEASRSADCVAICDCHAGDVVSAIGRIRTVTMCPMPGLPQVEAEIYDGTGIITLIWVGRRRIHGISPGRQIQVDGRVMCSTGQPTIYNPRYRLFPMTANG